MSGYSNNHRFSGNQENRIQALQRNLTTSQREVRDEARRRERADDRLDECLKSKREAEAAYRTMETEIGGLQAAAIQHGEELAKKNAEVEHLSQEVARITEEKCQQKGKLREQKRKNDDFVRKLEKAEAKAARYKRKAAELLNLQEDHRQLVAKIASLEEKHEQEHCSFSSKMKDMEKSVETGERRAMDLTSKNSELEQKMANQDKDVYAERRKHVKEIQSLHERIRKTEETALDNRALAERADAQNDRAQHDLTQQFRQNLDNVRGLEAVVSANRLLRDQGSILVQLVSESLQPEQALHYKGVFPEVMQEMNARRLTVSEEAARIVLDTAAQYEADRQAELEDEDDEDDPLESLRR